MSLAHVLPHVTATLNGLTAVLLAAAFVLVRAGRTAEHRKVMIAAVAVSALFLACYLVYHAIAPTFVFPGQGLVRTLYFTLLFSHIALAVGVLPLILLTVRRGLNDDRPRHRAIARLTFPLWMYTSLSGLTVYLLLYHVYS